MTAPEPAVRKIAVLRANSLGDLIFALPAFAALRDAYPHAELTLLATDWHERFLAGRPGPVDRVVVVPASRGVREEDRLEEDEAELERFFARMREERFDIGLQMHGGGRFSNPFVRRLGARVTAGSRAEDAAPLDRWIRYVYYQHEVARYLEIAALVGARPAVTAPRLELTEEDRAEIEPLVNAHDRLVVIHPVASDPRRRWPAESFAAVADALAADGATVALVATEPEREIVRQVAETMQREALDLTGRLSLGGLAAVLESAALVVGNDSGPIHVAEAVGTPTVAVYWIGNLINGAPLTRALHRPIPAFRVACPVCGLDCTTADCEHRESFVADVPISAVLDAARDLLATTSCAAHEAVTQATRPPIISGAGRRRSS